MQECLGEQLSRNSVFALPAQHFLENLYITVKLTGNDYCIIKHLCIGHRIKCSHLKVYLDIYNLTL